MSRAYAASVLLCFFFFQAEDGIRDWSVTGVQTCALPISWFCILNRQRPKKQFGAYGALRHYESLLRLEIQNHARAGGRQQEAKVKQWIRRRLWRMQPDREHDVHQGRTGEDQGHHIGGDTAVFERKNNTDRAASTERSPRPFRP